MSGEDIHTDENAERDDRRISVEEAGYGVDIHRQRYGLVKYDDGVRHFDWYNDETLHLRVDELTAVLRKVEDINIEEIQAQLNDIQRLDRRLEEAGSKS